MAGRSCFFHNCFHSDLKPKKREQEPWEFFCITARKGEFWEQWGNNVVNHIFRYQDVENKAAFYKRLAKGRVWICEKHYAPEDIELSSSK